MLGQRVGGKVRRGHVDVEAVPPTTLINKSIVVLPIMLRSHWGHVQKTFALRGTLNVWIWHHWGLTVDLPDPGNAEVLAEDKLPVEDQLAPNLMENII